jgi:NAD(P)-dependent dehydrogenase (short-subunit alcohol dehydrogenase family)
MLEGERTAASAEEAEALRPLLVDHLAWASGAPGGKAALPPPTTDAGGTAGAALLSVGGGAAAAAGHDSAGLSQLPVHADDWAVAVEAREAGPLALAPAPARVVLPEGVYDVNGQQLDTRRENSWLLKLGEVATVEAAEVLAINALAPFVLNSLLKPLLLAAAAGGEPTFVVNVSAMEGKFYRFKTADHPHTNMAKAALNMMTRTSAAALATEGIYMNSVDTGWINDENPLEKASRLAAEGFQTPIDEIDAAARILDPVVVGLAEPAVARVLHHGAFFKDYELTEW